MNDSTNARITIILIDFKHHLITLNDARKQLLSIIEEAYEEGKELILEAYP